MSRNKGGACEGYDPSKATRSLFMPLVMDRVGGYFTGFNIMNAGDSGTTGRRTLSDTSYFVNGELDPGETLTSLQNGKIGGGCAGSRDCTASGDGKIMGARTK
jgi:hypothetical protein